MSVNRVRATAGARADRPGLAYLENVFSLMYPSASVSLRRMPGGRYGYAWTLLPTRRNPSLLVPTRSRPASKASLDELGKRGHRVMGKLARLLASVGALQLCPRLIVSQRDGEDVQSVIARCVSRREVFVSMVVGRTRALQKPVLRIFGTDGVTLGYAKVGLSDTTRDLVRHETAVLRSFESDPPEHFKPPRVLGSEEWRELVVLVQEPLGAHHQASFEVVRRAAVEISGRGDAGTMVLRDSVIWQDLKRRVARLPCENAFAQQLTHVVEQIDQGSPDTLIQVGQWHGDFAPWNMSWDGSQLSVWDWEGHSGPIPAGFDLLHYRFQGDVVVGGRHPLVAFRDLVEDAPSLLSPWDPENPLLVVALYLLHLVITLIETGDAHARISRLDEWLQPALVSVTGAGMIA